MADEQVQGSGTAGQGDGQKKGIGTLAWVAIGCGVLILISFVAMSAIGWFASKKIKEVAGDFEANPAKAAAEVIVKMNPDLEMVESDDAEGTITVRQQSTGEIATFDYSQIKEGKLSFEAGGEEIAIDVTGGEEAGVLSVTTDEGEARFGAGAGAGDLPAWVPLYPGASEPESTYTATNNEVASGLFTMKSDDDVDAVLNFYRSELESAGYEVNVSTFSGSDGGQAGNVNGRKAESDTTLNISAGSQEGATQITIQYSGKL